MKNKDISKTSLWGLKQRYATSNGKDQEAGNELQRRGLNSKQLREILWEHGQQGWQKQAKRASKIHTAQRTEKRIQKKRKQKKQRRERRRQKQIAKVARLKEGVKIVGENFDPSASNGSCPFSRKEEIPMNSDDQFDYWIDLLCTCETHSETCEWHRRRRGPYDTRKELGEEMAEIIETSHAIELGVIDLPKDWETIPGRLRHYWAPADRGR